MHVLMDSITMDNYAYQSACTLLDSALVSKVYFARYSNPHENTAYVEFKVLPTASDEQIANVLRSYDAPEITTITVELFDGDDAHAEAFRLSRLLRGKGTDHAADVIHWLLNMTGYSYLDEIQLHASAVQHTANLLNRMEKGA